MNRSAGLLPLPTLDVHDVRDNRGGSGMTRTTYRRVLAGMTVLGVTAGATVLSAVPAGAESVARDDLGSDVYTWNTDDESPTVTESRRARNVAVQQVRAKHTRDAYVVATQMRSLSRNSDYFYLNSIIQRGDGTTYSAFLIVEPDDRNGRTVLQTPAGGETIACRGMTHDVDYRDDRLRITVPRRCLGDPARFRAYGAVINYPAGSVQGLSLIHI